MVDRGMSGHSGSNMWMNGPFLFCSLYYASGEKGKRRLSIASQSIGIKQNVSSVEACKGPKSQTKIASEGTCVCVCVRLLHPHQPCPRQALKTTTSKTAHLAPSQTALLPSRPKAKSVPVLLCLKILTYCACTTISDTNLKNSVYVNSNRDMVFALCLSSG